MAQVKVWIVEIDAPGDGPHTFHVRFVVRENAFYCMTHEASNATVHNLASRIMEVLGSVAHLSEMKVNVQEAEESYGTTSKNQS